MSRNKYPEETYQLILDVALKLVLSKGYENTSIQDIIDDLGGLTKGAIYHHFKSKTDILLAVVKYISASHIDKMASIRDDPILNGKDKLEKMLRVYLESSNQQEFFFSYTKPTG